MNQDIYLFEENLKKIEEIVRKMERGEPPLTESLRMFREGAELIEACEKLLKEARQQISIIMANSQGEPEEKEMEGADEL